MAEDDEWQDTERFSGAKTVQMHHPALIQRIITARAYCVLLHVRGSRMPERQSGKAHTRDGCSLGALEREELLDHGCDQRCRW